MTICGVLRDKHLFFLLFYHRIFQRNCKSNDRFLNRFPKPPVICLQTKHLHSTFQIFLVPCQCFLHTCLHLIGYIHIVFSFSYVLTESRSTKYNLIPLVVSVCTFSHFKPYSHNCSVKMLCLTFSKSLLQFFEHLWIFRQHRTRPKC